MYPHHPFQLHFWHYYLIQMRPYLLFLSGAAGLMGMAIGFERYQEVPQIRMFFAFPSFFLAYGFGQALTDCFQTDTDRISAPERPLSKGLIERTAVLYVSLVGLALSAGVLVWLNPLNLLLGLFSVAGLATYTFVKRKFWWGGPPYNAWIVTLLPVMGYLIAAPGLEVLPPLLLLMTFLSYANFVLMGYLKDISADAATGYRTFAVTFGWPTTVKVGHLLALASLVSFIPFLLVGGIAQWFAWLFAFYFAIAGQWHAATVKSENQTTSLFAITCTVRTFLLLQWAAILVFQPNWLLAGVLYYMLFEGALYFRYEHNQV